MACLRVITGKRDASAVAPNVWLLNCRHVEVKLTCQRLRLNSPKPSLEGSGWCLLRVCVEDKHSCYGDDARFRTPGALRPQ